MWEAAREIFGRTLNGCGHRQIGMCLRAEHHVRITNKTVLKMMREMGLRCLIRRKKKPGAYSSYKGDVGKIFPNKRGIFFRKNTTHCMTVKTICG